MHHVALCLPNVIVLLFYIFSKLPRDRLIHTLGVIFLGANVVACTKIPTLPIAEHIDKGAWDTCRTIDRRFGKDHVVMVVDWGIFYMKSLYGEGEQCVVSVEEGQLNDASTLAAVERLLEATDRKALFLYQDNDGASISKRSRTEMDAVKMRFPRLVECGATPETSWRILYEP
jgi:hypothetical protein